MYFLVTLLKHNIQHYPLFTDNKIVSNPKKMLTTMSKNGVVFRLSKIIVAGTSM